MTFQIADAAPPDHVARLVADMHGVRRFAAPFNYRFRRPAIRRLAPSLVEVPDADVDLDYHPRHSALAQPGEERELGVLFSRPLDPNRPLWEIHIIEGLAGNRFAWFFKIGHVLMDGMAARRRFERMLGADPDDGRLTPIWSLEPEARRVRARHPCPARGARDWGHAVRPPDVPDPPAGHPARPDTRLPRPHLRRRGIPGVDRVDRPHGPGPALLGAETMGRSVRTPSWRT